jgi:hypothetical protein
MSITPDMLSRPPGDGEVFCSIHGIGKFVDGACGQCLELLKDEAIITCPSHGIQYKNEAGECPGCGPDGPPKLPEFAPPPDAPAVGVSPKPGYGNPRPKRTEPKAEAK